MKALDRGQIPTITPDLTDELFVVQVDADGVARDGRASIGTLLEATASSQYAPRTGSTAYASGTIGQLIKSGWYSSPPGGAANVAYSTGVMTYIPIIIPAQGATIDRIGVEVTTGGTAGAVVRLGIYEPGADGLPATKLLDAGTIDSTSTGFKEITISQALTPGLHWLAAVAQTAGCSLKGASSAQGGFGIGGLAVSGSQAVTSVACGYYSTGITGALTTSPTVNGMETQPI